jgi:hypothetical protein
LIRKGEEYLVGRNKKTVPGADSSYIFFWGKFWGKFRGKFSPKNVEKKKEFSAEKALKNRFSQEIPRKVIFRGKKCTKNWPQTSVQNITHF